MLVVIWALGWAMIVLAALVWLPLPAILAIGVVMIAGHNLLDGIRSAHPLWIILHSQGFVVNRPGFVVFVAYPLVPWIGVTAVGYALGQIYRWDPERRRAFLLRCGLGLTAAFVVLRAAQHLRRSRRRGHRRRRRAHDGRVVPQRDEVSAVAAVPADDARPGAAAPARAGRPRRRGSCGRRWSSAACRCSTSCCT